MHNTPDTRSTAELEPHPILKSIPAPAKDDEKLKGKMAFITACDGRMTPLLIDPRGRILDDISRLTWLAAQRLAIEHVPVLVVHSPVPEETTFDVLVNRNHWSKGTLAYIISPWLEPIFKTLRDERAKNLRIGQNPNDLPKRHPVPYRETHITSAKDLAEAVGICERTLRMARDLREKFEDGQKRTFKIEGGPRDGEEVQRTFREHYEPELFRQQTGDEHESTRPKGLSAILKAIGGHKATKGGTRKDRGQLELFDKFISASVCRLPAYDDMLSTDADRVRQGWRKMVEAMPDAAITDLKAAIRDRERAAKGA